KGGRGGRAAGEAGGGAGHEPADERDQDREHAHQQRDSRAVDHAREDVAPELVGAQPILGAGARALLDQALARGIIEREPRRQRRRQQQDEDEPEADERQAVLAEAQPRVHASRCDQPWRAMRGSRTPYERSTIRLMTTKASAKTSTAPCSRT